MILGYYIFKDQVYNIRVKKQKIKGNDNRMEGIPEIRIDEKYDVSFRDQVKMILARRRAKRKLKQSLKRNKQ